jgi:transcriptional regulator with XRE-family HTH domain
MNRVRKARLMSDKTQLQLMKETGIYFSTISKIERGWLKPSEEQKKKLAKALDKDEDWVFPKEEN